MFENYIEPIAEAYGRIQPGANGGAVIAGMWSQLAADSVTKAETIRVLLNVAETDDPEPYETAGSMLRDIARGEFVVSRAFSEHPLWTVDENVAFRIVHDVIGHYGASVYRGWTPRLNLGDSLEATAGFDWAGECAACSTHVKVLPDAARSALFCECLGQTAYAIERGGFTDQRVGFITGPLAISLAGDDDGGFLDDLSRWYA